MPAVHSLGCRAAPCLGALIGLGRRMLQVICVDNFFTGSKDNIAALIGKPNFEVIRHDITERLVLEVDQIYHLACPASPVHYK